MLSPQPLNLAVPPRAPPPARRESSRRALERLRTCDSLTPGPCAGRHQFVARTGSDRARPTSARQIQAAPQRFAGLGAKPPPAWRRAVVDESPAVLELGTRAFEHRDGLGEQLESPMRLLHETGRPQRDADRPQGAEGCRER